MSTNSSTNPPEPEADGNGRPGHYYSYGIPYLSFATTPVG